MNKFFGVIFVVAIMFGILNLGFSNTMTEQGKQLVDSKISCDTASDEQLEQIGDYYMEQMHPGQAHELMDNMMGGEGSEQLKQVHIYMAKNLYCEDKTTGYGIMGNGGMMSMMGGFGGMMGYGSNVAGYSTGWSTFFSIFWILIMLGILLVIILVIIKLIKAM